ncbi:MAG: DRTGG domain-containing protein [Bacteroidota bacterium]
MNISEIARLINGEILTGNAENGNLTKAFSSDLMSDVLTLETENTILITGLANLQAIRTAEMSDIDCIIFARNKKVTEDMVNLAKENNMIVIRTPCSVFKTSGMLYNAGIEPIF